jgi:hypothetical protein
MLWNKAWLETRWRFAIGLALLLVMACGVVFTYRTVQQLMPLASSVSREGGALGRLVGEAAAIEGTYRGYVWWQWFRQNLCQTWTLFALLLGTGGLTLQGTRGGALYTLSLPVSRTRLLAVRVGTGLAQLAVLAVVPSVVITVLSPTIGQSYAIVDVLVHGLCLFLAGTAVFCLTVFFSTQFADAWSPALLTLIVVVVLAAGEFVAPALRPYSLFRTMSGESYLLDGTLPWAGFIVSVTASAALLVAADRNLRRRDF